MSKSPSTNMAHTVQVLASGIIASITTLVALITAHFLNHKQPERLSRRQRIWKQVLNKHIISFADLQLFTGFALLISSLVNTHKYITIFGMADPLDFQDAHFILVIYQCCLCASVNFACLIKLGDKLPKDRKSTNVRVGIIVLFGLLLAIVIALSHHAFEPFTWIL